MHNQIGLTSEKFKYSERAILNYYKSVHTFDLAYHLSSRWVGSSMFTCKFHIYILEFCVKQISLIFLFSYSADLESTFFNLQEVFFFIYLYWMMRVIEILKFWASLLIIFLHLKTLQCKAWHLQHWRGLLFQVLKYIWMLCSYIGIGL